MNVVCSNYYRYRSPHGIITIAAKNHAICAVFLGKTDYSGTEKPTELTNLCATELLEYFAGKRRDFDLPLAPKGSDFQQEVWQACETVCYGQTTTSADIAKNIGRPQSFRMVGAALKQCPIAVLIPTHRVIGANGHTSGADASARIRAALLEMERRNISNSKK